LGFWFGWEMIFGLVTVLVFLLFLLDKNVGTLEWIRENGCGVS
jgi:uncharacterized membrane protein YsdA (DUF1294 family)